MIKKIETIKDFGDKKINEIIDWINFHNGINEHPLKTVGIEDKKTLSDEIKDASKMVICGGNWIYADNVKQFIKDIKEDVVNLHHSSVIGIINKRAGKRLI